MTSGQWLVLIGLCLMLLVGSIFGTRYGLRETAIEATTVKEAIDDRLRQVTFPDGTRCVVGYANTQNSFSKEPLSLSCNWGKTHE